VLRSSAALLLTSFFFVGCGPDHRRCSGPHPDFVVVLELSNRSLPADAVVHVTYGGSGMEEYVVAAPSADPEVVFCSPASADGGAPADTAGAAGTSGEDASVEALRCELWTGGFASVMVRGTGLSDMHYDLTPDDNQCTVRQTIVLDSPDGG
jgi:hypothetical protein